MTRRTVAMTSALALVGLSMLGGSALLSRRGDAWWNTWWSGLLVEVGAAVAVLVPLYIITRSLDRHIEEVRTQTVAKVDQVREATAASVDQVRAAAESSVEALTERVSAFEGDVDRRLDEIAATVAQRVSDDRLEDLALFERLRTAPTRDGVVNALRRAEQRGLISSPAPRVAATGHAWGPYVRFVSSDEAFVPELRLTVEAVDGEQYEWIEWKADDSVEDVMVHISHVIHREVDGRLDVTSLFEGLCDLLHVASATPECRPIVQVCAPRYAVSQRGIVTFGKGGDAGFVSLAEVQQVVLDEAETKPLAGGDSYALALYVAMTLLAGRDPWVHSSEPPF